ncbi:MAG: DUF4157 domain-containing protein [Desulfobacteraceae bacterium]
MAAFSEQNLTAGAAGFPCLGNRLLLFWRKKVSSLNNYLEKFYLGRLGMLKVKPMRLRSLQHRQSMFRMGYLPLPLVKTHPAHLPSANPGGRRDAISLQATHGQDSQTDAAPSHARWDAGWVSNGAPRAVKERNGEDALLPANVLRIFSRYLRRELPPVRIHRSDMIDRYLGQRGADAMTIGSDIFFRNGRFGSGDNRSTALLGHELTHVAQQTSPHGSPAAGVHMDPVHEDASLGNERFIYSHLTRSHQSLDTLPAVHTGAAPVPSQAPTSQAMRPMFAETNRNMDAPAALPSAAKTAAEPDLDMSRIKDEIYRDLMQRMKIDLERGS